MDVKTVVDDLVDVIKKDIVTILVCSLISIVLSVISLGFLSLVLYVGMGSIFLKLKNNEEIEYKDLFKYIDKFLYLLILSLIIGIITLLGTFLLIIPGILAAVLLIYSPFYYTYENKSIFESLKLSYETVLKNNFLVHIIAFIILLILYLIGIYLFYIGSILVYPIWVGFWVLFFEKIKIKN